MNVDQREISQWLQFWYGGCGGRIQILSKTNGGFSYRSFADPAAAAAYARQQVAAQSVYFRMGTLPPQWVDHPKHRGGNEDTYALPGIGVDLDFGRLGHDKPNYPPDAAAARALVEPLPLPTVWIHSGGGVYPFWMFTENVILARSPWAQDMFDDLNAIIGSVAGDLGYAVDKMSAAQLFRLPGTVNCKAGLERPCRVLSMDGPRYDAVKFTAICAGLADKLRRSESSPREGHSRSSVTRDLAQTEDILSRMAPSPSCKPVHERKSQMLANLEYPEGSDRHPVIAGPLLALVRLGVNGHAGVSEAVAQIRDAFITAAVRDGSRTEAQATDEWQRALSGALKIIRRQPKRRPCCRCVIAEIRRRIDSGIGLSKGVGRGNEAKVMRYLLERAGSEGSLLVKESVRQISEHIAVPLLTVHRTLSRLQSNGALERIGTGSATRPASYAIERGDDNLITTKTFPPPTPAETSVVITLSSSLHPLLASYGGAAETFARLPLLAKRDQDGVIVAANREGGWSPLEGSSELSVMPGSCAPGVTAKQIAASCHKSVETIRRHLRRLRSDRVALRFNGLWYRTLFNADEVAADLGVIDRRPLLRARHAAEREANYRQLFKTDRSVDRSPLFDGSTGYVNIDTGEVLSNSTE